MATRAPSLFIAILLAALGVATGAPATELTRPGTVISESSKELGFGLREVHRSKVSSPGLFEGVGHFSFVYFRDELLCQCRYTEIMISPDGRYSIFVNSEDGILMLFQSGDRELLPLSQQYVGHPVRAEWTESRVIVTLIRYEDGTARNSKINVSL